MTDEKTSVEKATEGRFAKVVNYVTVVLFMVLLFTPLALLVTTGEDKAVLENEKEYSLPTFTAANFLTSEFQGNFENWFSHNYPMRGKLVDTYYKIEVGTSNMGFDVATVFMSNETEQEKLAEQPETTSDVAVSGDSVEGTAVVEEPKSPYSDFNEPFRLINKRLYEREAVEMPGYKGNDQVIIGKTGYLYENGYVNELYGYSQKYRDCSDEYLAERVEKLTYIQQELKNRGKEFAFIITPSKAYEYERFIPEWYKTRNAKRKDYVRPVTRLIPMLEEAGIHYLHCSTLYDEIGLDETFPLTGIHWNKIAAFEACRKMVDIYEELRGYNVRNMKYNNIIKSSKVSGFGSHDADIFGIVNRGDYAREAIRDDLYYWPEVIIEDEGVQKTFSLLLQGGSFSWDLKYYYETYGLIDRLSQFDYNRWQGDSRDDPLKHGEKAWEKALMGIDYVIFECNEQYVCMMGTDPPRWGNQDKEPLADNRTDVYESLYNYLKSTERN